MNEQIAAKIAKFKEDITASAGRRDALVAEANKVHARIQQLQGAVFALEELAHEEKQRECAPSPLPAPDAEIKK